MVSKTPTRKTVSFQDSGLVTVKDLDRFNLWDEMEGQGAKGTKQTDLKFPLKGILVWGLVSTKTRYRDTEHPDAAIAKFDFLLPDGKVIKFYSMGSAIVLKVREACERYGNADGELNPAIDGITIGIREAGSGRDYPDFI